MRRKSPEAFRRTRGGETQTQAISAGKKQICTLAARTAVEGLHIAVDHSVLVHVLKTFCELLETEAHSLWIIIWVIRISIRVQALGLHDQH